MNNELYHHGVLGMRWRWHKAKPQVQPKTTSINKKEEQPIKFHKQHELLNRDIRTLSNQELMELRDRKRLLNELNQKQTKSFDQNHKRFLNGAKYIQTLSKTVASTVAIIKAIDYLNNRKKSNKKSNQSNNNGNEGTN